MPYVLVPGRRTGSQPSTASQGGGSAGSGGDCVGSYPASHAAGIAAGRTYLTFLNPHSATTPTYTAVEDQIDYSRMYVAGHIPGDIAAGALLGDVVG